MPVTPYSLPEVSDELRAAFFAFVPEREADECWEWQGKLSTKGYGKFYYRRRTYVASRMALHFDGRSPGQAQWVCHKCDNRRCVNPAHLFLGTQRENIADMIEKGRNRPARGERSGAAKLTERDVLAIRASTEKHPIVAARFGVSITTISEIRNYRKWKHVA